MNQIIKYVNECDESFFPLTQTALLHWINTTFSKELTISWLQFFISNEKQLFIVDFEPIEEARSKITEQQLIENAKQLNDKVTRSNSNLILNVDETTLDSKKDFNKIKVVSITFMLTVAIIGWFLPILIIIKSITVISDLAI
jgi:hypothetical protein